MPPNEPAARESHAAATILVISPNEADQEFFRSVFQFPFWKAYNVGTYREALKWLTRDRMNVIVCDCQLPDGSWKDILSQTQVLPDPPCVIVTSLLPDDLLWAEVLNMGGYDVVAKPFVREEAVRIVELASMNAQRVATNRDETAKPRKTPRAESSPPRKWLTAAGA